jgi:hypothetical protein
MKRRGYIIAAKKKKEEEDDDELMKQVLKILEEPIKVIKLQDTGPITPPQPHPR